MDEYPGGVEGIISNSQGNTLLRCEQRFYYKFVRNLSPRRPALPLHRGGWVHQLLHAHYSGEDWRQAHRKLSGEFERLFDEEKDYYGDLPKDILRIMGNYVWTWRDEIWKPIVAELEVNHKLSNGWTYRGRVDLIIEDEHGDSWLVEHKTTSHTPPGELRLMDPQTHRYFWALADQYDLRGIIYNYIRTKPPTVPELLKSGGLTRRSNIDTTVRTYLSAIKAAGLDPEEYEDVLIELRNKPSAFCWRYRVPRHQATVESLVKDLIPLSKRMSELWQGRRPLRVLDFRCHLDCEYRDLCLVELGGGNPEKIVKVHFTVKEVKEDEIEEDEDISV
jgi:hypothetical protein